MKELEFSYGIISTFEKVENLLLLREVNKKWNFLSDNQLVERYIYDFGTEKTFLSLITILLMTQPDSVFSKEKKDLPSTLCHTEDSKIVSHAVAKLSKNLLTNHLKLFRLIFISEKMQKKIMEKIKNTKKELSFFWQMLAGIAVLNTKNFNSLSQQYPDIQILSLLKGQRAINFHKTLLEKIVLDKTITTTYSSADLKSVILFCIKIKADYLLEFLLRIGSGNLYQDKYLLTESTGSGFYYQHPLITCFNCNNLVAFQLFLTYAPQLLYIYDGYSSLSFRSPPLCAAAFSQKTDFITIVAKQRPDALSLKDDCGSNIVHKLLRGGGGY